MLNPSSILVPLPLLHARVLYFMSCLLSRADESLLPPPQFHPRSPYPPLNSSVLHDLLVPRRGYSLSAAPLILHPPSSSPCPNVNSNTIQTITILIYCINTCPERQSIYTLRVRTAHSTFHPHPPSSPSQLVPNLNSVSIFSIKFKYISYHINKPNHPFTIHPTPSSPQSTWPELPPFSNPPSSSPSSQTVLHVDLSTFFTIQIKSISK